MTNRYPEYAGLAYDAASREGLRLVKAAAKNENWFFMIDRLVALRTIMNEHFDKVN